uniref:(northern house mosquito) hypothetical protein n=1 Tax=Culex pipiens TaxID=7175 RepID=A0A8D8JLL6_CULPI
MHTHKLARNFSSAVEPFSGWFFFFSFQLKVFRLLLPRITALSLVQKNGFFSPFPGISDSRSRTKTSRNCPNCHFTKLTLNNFNKSHQQQKAAFQEVACAVGDGFSGTENDRKEGG